MALTDEEKQRIREEELVRLQVRDEYRLAHRTQRPCSPAPLFKGILR
jgi:hypothetical protein